MLQVKKWMERHNSLDEYDNPDIDPDIVLEKRMKVVKEARNVLRSQLEKEFRSAIMAFYSGDPLKKLM